jgi:hypothetical protein
MTSLEEEVPVEVSEQDFDEVSSMGSAGVSLCAVKKFQKSGKPLSLQVMNIEGLVEL